MAASGPAIEPKARELPDELTGELVLCRPYQENDSGAMLEMSIESREHLIRWLGSASDINTVDDAREAVIQRRSA